MAADHIVVRFRRLHLCLLGQRDDGSAADACHYKVKAVLVQDGDSFLTRVVDESSSCARTIKGHRRRGC